MVVKTWIAGLFLILAVVKSDAQELIEKSNLYFMGVDSTDNMLACRLTNSELAKRKGVLQAKLFSRLMKVEGVAGGYLFYFDDTGSLLQDLFHYVLAEKQCCPFFDQKVGIGANDSGITWEVSGGEEVKKLIVELFDQVDFLTE